MFLRAALFCSLLAAEAAALGLELDDYRLVDLTHAYNEETIYWPSAPSRFELTTLTAGRTAGGYYYIRLTRSARPSTAARIWTHPSISTRTA